MDEAELRRLLGLPTLSPRTDDEPCATEEKKDVEVFQSIPSPQSSVTPTQQSRLLSLPSEIRLRIYESILCFPDVIVQIRRNPVVSRGLNERSSALDLLRTCRQIHREAEDIFYSQNQLHYPTGSFVPSYHGSYFLQSLGSTRRHAIRYIVFSAVSATAAFRILTELLATPNIETLRIERTQSAAFTDVHGWRMLVAPMQKALQKFQHLRELEMITPGPLGRIGSSLGGAQLMQELKDIDAMLQGALAASTDNNGS